jgi:hypothetical protein
VTPVGKQIDRLQMESELLYFRKNHGMRAVIADVLFISLADLLKLLRAVTRRNRTRSAPFARSKALWSVFALTKQGRQATR